MKRKEMMLPLLFAAVAFLHCLSILWMGSGLFVPAHGEEIEFFNMLIMVFCAVLMTAYPYHLLHPQSFSVDIREYALTKSIVFGCCALPFLALMVYIYQTYGDGWRPLAVSNVWSFSMAYVMCCWGFCLFLVTTSYDMCHQN